MDRETIAHLERLARIDLAPGERRRLVGELGRIVAYASELQAADADEPAAGADAGSALEAAAPHAGDSKAETAPGLRLDSPGECLERGAVLGGAPGTDERKELFRVPRVIPE